MMAKFVYQLDNQQFRLPWAQPCLYRLKLWYIDLLASVETMGRYDVYLAGGSWSASTDQENESWDVDLYLCPDDDIIDPENVGELSVAHEIMSRGYSLALNDYRFLLDFTLLKASRLFLTHESHLSYESDRNAKMKNQPHDQAVLGIFNEYRKVRNGEVILEYSKTHADCIRVGEGRYFYAKPDGGVMEKQMSRIRAGRVSNKPISLSKLFG